MTSFLTREEFHKRVDHYFDAIEEHGNGEPIAVIGDLTGKMNAYAPNDNRDHYKLSVNFGYVDFGFGSNATMLLGEAASTPRGGLLGTVILDLPQLSEEIQEGIEEVKAENG